MEVKYLPQIQNARDLLYQECDALKSKSFWKYMNSRMKKYNTAVKTSYGFLKYCQSNIKEVNTDLTELSLAVNLLNETLMQKTAETLPDQGTF